jgi:hypothetical protein
MRMEWPFYSALHRAYMLPDRSSLCLLHRTHPADAINIRTD